MSWKTPEERATYVKNALTKAGLSLELANTIKGEDEASVLSEINVLLIADIDRRVNKAVETNAAKLKKEHETEMAEIKAKLPAQQQTQTDTGNPDAGTAQTEIAKIVQDILKPITERLDTLDREKVADKRSGLIKNALKEAGLSEDMAKYINVDDDAKVTEAVDALKKDMLGVKQAEIDEALANGQTPGKGAGASTLAENAAADYAKSRNQKNGFGGDFATIDPFAYKNSPSQTGVAKT